MFCFFTTCYVAAFVLLILSCYVERFHKYHLFFKCLNSMLFLLIAVYGMTRVTDDIIFWRLFPAFCFCFLGDFFLARKLEAKAEKNFVYGLASFLAAHCLFLIAFSFLEPSTFFVFLLPVLGVFLTMILMNLKKMVVGKFKKPVLVYSYFVTALFVKCGQLYLLENDRLFNKLVFLGGTLFLVSDMIILFLYFYQTKYKVVRFLNLFTYYSATYFLALAIWVC